MIRHLQLHQNWVFRKKGDEKWLPANVPGSVHTDLLSNGKIPDPFLRQQYLESQWVENEEWEYSCRFIIDKEFLERDQVELVFEGLDTFANVSLNNIPVLRACNMYREWYAEVKAHLKEGENTLLVHFLSPVRSGEKHLRMAQFTYPANNEQSETKVSPFVRRAPYTFGWDWCPRLVGCGIWRPVYLRGWNTATIEHIHITPVNITEERALVKAEIILKGAYRSRCFLSVWLNDTVLAGSEVTMRKGEQSEEIEFVIERPKLWWPNGLGRPHLYEISVVLEDENRKVQKKSIKTGIRTVELIQEPDAKGVSFYFRVNGISVFMKGANWVPPDFFPHRVTRQQYKQLIDSCKEAHMNMLRVWGGAYYEDDYFYELCDEAGILVWQDFMFACGMYPADREFLQNVKEEVKDNVIRLRNHPCIALWCGNNEVLEGFTNWGWQEEIGKPFIKMAYEEYKKLFHETIPSILKELDPERPYWPSSPSSFMHGPPELTSGDFHYWDIIKEEIPFSSYASHVGRFMSEYGFKSYPAMETIQQYALPEDFDTRSDVMEAHQGWPGGRELVERHLLEGFRQPKDFESFVYLSQLMQSLALQTAIEAHRKAKPYCMGSLYWQLDDCWPCASWSGIDYYGNYKAFQYHLKHYFAPVLIIPSADKKKIEIAIVSDLPYAVSATLLVQLIDFDGIIKKSYHTQLRLGSGVSRNCFQQPILEWTRDIDLRYTILHIALTEKLRLLAEKLYFFVPIRQLELPDPKIRTEFETVTDGTRIIINTSSFAKNVYIISSLATTRFSDNFFDMLPGEEKEVLAYHSPVSKAPESIFRIVTVRDTYCG